MGDVLRTLRAHDNELAEELDIYRFSLGRRLGRSSGQTLKKVVIDLPISFDKHFGDAIQAKLVEMTTAS